MPNIRRLSICRHRLPATLAELRHLGGQVSSEEARWESLVVPIETVQMQQRMQQLSVRFDFDLSN